MSTGQAERSAHECEQYRLGDLVDQISTPMLITDPEGESFWPGQAQRLFNALPGTKTYAPFTEAEGAGMHCEPMARSLVTQRIFDWLDTVKSATGRMPVLYSYPSWFDSVGITDAQLAGYPLFIASYNSCATVPGPWTQAPACTPSTPTFTAPRSPARRSLPI